MHLRYSTWTYNGSTRGYQYNYDALNRYTGGYAFINNVMQDGYQYSESFNYDKMGNITYLERFSAEDISDQLFLYYNGNQLKYVDDNGIQQSIYGLKDYQNKSNTQDEFAYDANGNMIKDLDRDIYTIRYNLLNLPDTIQFKNGHQIINKYDASGKKLSTRYYTVLVTAQVPLVSTLTPGKTIKLQYDMDIIDETGTFYVDNFEYGFNGCDPGWYWVERIYNPEGYFKDRGDFGDKGFNYFRRDHLGNNREVWHPLYSFNNISFAEKTIQRTQYYPSGLLWAESTGAIVQNKKYNGKEWIEMHGLDEYDSQARMYYPAIMRTTTLDPLAEKYYSISPYAWCGNNPVNRIDPDGMDWYTDKDKSYQYNPNLNAENSKKILKKGQSYVGVTHQVKDKNGNVITDYRKDGSIMFASEKSAYNRMWTQANKFNREVGGVALKNGKTLVLPDYKNDNNTMKIPEYGYLLEKGKITDNDKKSYQITGLIHTHQDKSVGDATPSLDRHEDIGLSRQMGGLPIMTMGWDEQLHGIIWTGINPKTGGYTYNTIIFNTTNEQLIKGNTITSLNLYLRTLIK